MELSKGGTQPLAIGSDEHRTFLEDGDSRDFSRLVRTPRRTSIGFGEVSGRVLPAAVPARHNYRSFSYTDKISPVLATIPHLEISPDGWPHARIRYDFAYAWLLRGTAARAAARIVRSVGANRARSRFQRSGADISRPPRRRQP